jgi:hypothetical protein
MGERVSVTVPGLFEGLAPEDKALLFKPYRWRDPARVTPQRAAELAAIERADWGGCSQCYQPWHLCRCEAR